MAKTWTNRGLYSLATGTFNSATLNVAALKGTPPASATIKDYNFVSEIIAGMTAGGEAAASGYARVAITKTITETDASDRVDIAYNNPSLGATVAAGETWSAVACFNTSGGADSARELIWVDVPVATIATNGSGITYTSAADTFAAS